MGIAENACFHCGEPISAGTALYVQRDGQQRAVCCAGCQAVAELIFRSGLGRYYQFRQELGRKAEAGLAHAIAAWEGCDARESLWGAELADGRRELLLQTEGIRCAACAWLIRSHLEKLPGVQSTQVDTATGYTRIIWQPKETRLSRLAAGLMELGYKPHLPLAGAEEQGRQEERRESMKRVGVAGLGMMQVMMYAVGLYAGDAFGIAVAERSFLAWVSLAVTLPVLLYSGRVFFEGAWRSLRARRPGMDVPVALAIALAFLASCYHFFRGDGEVWFDSVVMFIFFLSLGRHMEMMLRHRNLQAGAALARLLPEWAERIRGERRETVPAGDLESGDRVVVRAGESFPADGHICAGATEVDEALLTGESRAVARVAGDLVIAGTINLSQPVEVEVTACGQDTAVSSMGRLLLRAQATRPATHSLPAWLVPAFIVSVLLIAAATWLGWQYVDPSRAFSAMLAVLVVSCPCALSLALPVVHAAASRRLLDEGILLTRGDALHALNEVDTVVFDKTGTLTLGEPVLTGHPSADALAHAAMLARASRHPFSRAIARAAGSGPVASTIIEHPGEGVSGVVDGREARLGSAAYVGAAGQGGSELWFAFAGDAPVAFHFEDALRPEAKETIARLRKMGLSVELLSGDSSERVAIAAAAAGIDAWRAAATPVSKAQRLSELEKAGRKVLMVGDGLNDAAALAGAHASLAPGGAVDVSRLASDCVYSGDSLKSVALIIEVARAARRRMRENFAFAALYNLIAVPVAVVGWATPMVAAAAMSLSSAIVTLNALRLSIMKLEDGAS